MAKIGCIVSFNSCKGFAQGPYTSFPVRVDNEGLLYIVVNRHKLRLSTAEDHTLHIPTLQVCGALTVIAGRRQLQHYLSRYESLSRSPNLIQV